MTHMSIEICVSEPIYVKPQELLVGKRGGFSFLYDLIILSLFWWEYTR